MNRGHVARRHLAVGGIAVSELLPQGGRMHYKLAAPAGTRRMVAGCRRLAGAPGRDRGENGIRRPSRRGRAQGAAGRWRRGVSIGEVLATARRQAGLTTTQVSQRTRIREGIVRGIEADDFSACGADFYARGHIRAIARSVGTDPEPLVGEYDSSHSLPPARAAASEPGPSTPFGPASAAGRTGAGALRCWPSSRRSPAWAPITSWRLAPLAAPRPGPAPRPPPRTRPRASTRPRRPPRRRPRRLMHAPW